MATEIVAAGALVEMSAIEKPEGLAELLRDPRVKRRAESIKAVTQIHPIVLERIDQGKFKLWAGKDRYAAVTLAKLPKIRADIRKGSPGDFELLQRAENDERRNVTQVVETIAMGGGQLGELSPRRNAIRDVAASKGVKPESVEKQLQREAKKAREPRPVQHSKPFGNGSRPVEPGPGFKPPSSEPNSQVLPLHFDTLGLTLGEKRELGIRDTHDLLSRWKSTIAEVQEEVRVYSNGGLADVIAGMFLDGISSALKMAILAIENTKPIAICRTCKDEDSKDCSRCHGTGVVGRFGNEPSESEVAREPGVAP
jgi:hypothetical protein